MSLDLDRSKWQRVRFGDVVYKVADSGLPNSQESRLYVGLEHMPTDGTLNVTSWGSDVDIVVTKTKVLRGDVLFARRNTSLRRVAVAPHDGYFSPDGYAFRPVDERLTNDFLPWLVASSSFMDFAVRNSAGTHSKRVRWSELAKFEFDLPPLADQRRIADLLWCLESHQRSVSQLLETTDALRSQLASEICYQTGEMRQLGEVLEVVRGGSPRPIRDFITEAADGINWIKIGDVAAGGKYITKTEEKIKPAGLSKTRRVSPGALLLSNSMSFGRPYIVQIDGCIHDGWLALSDQSSLWRTEYLYYLLRSSQVQAQFQRAAAGSAVKNLNKEIVASVQVPVPALQSQDDALDQFDVLESSLSAMELECGAMRELQMTVLNALAGGAL